MQAPFDTSRFERECKVMQMFIDNAKTYLQLSTGALILSITFMREVVGVPQNTALHPGRALIAAWICFLVAVITGALYQYHAVKYVELHSGLPRSHRSWSDRFNRHPYLLYGAMLISFFSGAALFTAAAIIYLL
jgi:hypothetical protein